MNETTSKTKRLQYVDIARGIAMICIILGHLGNPAYLLSTCRFSSSLPVILPALNVAFLNLPKIKSGHCSFRTPFHVLQLSF